MLRAFSENHPKLRVAFMIAAAVAAPVVTVVAAAAAPLAAAPLIGLAAGAGVCLVFDALDVSRPPGPGMAF